MGWKIKTKRGNNKTKKVCVCKRSVRNGHWLVMGRHSVYNGSNCRMLSIKVVVILRRVLLLLLTVMLLLPLWAAGEETRASFWGYFDRIVYIRPEPGSNVSLGFIPAETPVELTPMDELFARVNYSGKEGCVYYVGVRDLPRETPVTPYAAYLPNAKYLFAQPMDRAESLLTIPAETPVTVTATVGKFVRVTALGREGYVYARDTADLAALKESPVNTELYSEAAVTARVLPLKNAEKAFELEPGRVYVADAVCNDHYRVTLGGQIGYVSASDMARSRVSGKTVRVGVITPETPVYASAETTSACANPFAGEEMALLESQGNGFYRVKEQALYVHVNDVVSYVVQLHQGQRLQTLQQAEVRAMPLEEAEIIAGLGKDQVYLAEYSVEDWYLLKVNGQWGFMKKDPAVASALRVDGTLMRTAGKLVADGTLFTDEGKKISLPAGTGLFLLESAGRFYGCTAGEYTGLVAKDNVKILGNDTELTAYSIATATDITAMDFPDAAIGGESFTVPAGESMKVTGFNRCYLMVEYAGKTGYAPQHDLLTEESRGIPAAEDVPDYALVLDKSTLMAYAFEKTADGELGELVICAKVGIGKATTPTPSGTFTLGKKERWHRFPRTYTPHTTEYVRARFIHGWPCAGKSEARVSNYLVATGRVTGGCLRSPFEFARWVYMNCPSYATELTVVNGGFEAPENAGTLQVY